MKISKLFELFPVAEVFVRNLYWRLSWVQNIVSKTGAGKDIPIPQTSFSGAQLLATLRQMGIREDDIVVVHSSMRELAPTGLTSTEILHLLSTELCPKGTIVCPTFPLYAKEPKGKERMTKDISNQVFVYDVQKTRTWTGELGRALMATPGARRSIHPLNTITAYGAAVDQIFANEKIDNIDLPCGRNSTWASLAKMNAKIIMLGVDLTHSLTMIHVAEDCYEAEWPVKGWYRKRLFKIINQGNTNLVSVRERHPKWAMSYAERKLSRDLFSMGIAEKFTTGSLAITVVESKSLIEFLGSKRKQAYPYYLTWLSNL
jgi:aminoglycoside 3-N-acetyltransferase